MKPNEILSAQLLDIVFEGRNKEYGAYDLRKTYKKRMAISLVTMVAACLIFSFLQLFAFNAKEEVKPIYVKDHTLTEVDPLEKKIKPVVPLPKKVELPRIKTEQFVVPVIVDDNKVKEPMPDIETLTTANISTFKQDGIAADHLIAPPLETSTTTVSIKKADEDFETTFKKIEKEARFPGGAAAWKRYLERSLNANVAADDGASVGLYSVKVQFVVDQQGNISQVEASEIPSMCPSCGIEAVRVIKKGPKWEPAIQNGKSVTYQAVQFVTFEVAADF